MNDTPGLRESVPPPLEIRRAPEPLFGDRVSATTLYLLVKCDRRLWLTRHRPELAAPPGDFEQLLWEKGRGHERAERHKTDCRSPATR